MTKKQIQARYALLAFTLLAGSIASYVEGAMLINTGESTGSSSKTSLGLALQFFVGNTLLIASCCSGLWSCYPPSGDEPSIPSVRRPATGEQRTARVRPMEELSIISVRRPATGEQRTARVHPIQEPDIAIEFLAAEDRSQSTRTDTVSVSSSSGSASPSGFSHDVRGAFSAYVRPAAIPEGLEPV